MKACKEAFQTFRSRIRRWDCLGSNCLGSNLHRSFDARRTSSFFQTETDRKNEQSEPNYHLLGGKRQSRAESSIAGFHPDIVPAVYTCRGNLNPEGTPSGFGGRRSSRVRYNCQSRAREGEFAPELIDDVHLAIVFARLQ